MRSHHIYARAFCRALLEHGKDANAWCNIADVVERMGIKPDEGFVIARECASRAWIERMADSVRLREEGRRIALHPLSFRKDSNRPPG